MSNPIDLLLDRYEDRKLTRREPVVALLAVGGAASLTHQAVAQVPAAMPVAIGRSMNHVSLSVADVNISAEFYQRVLGMEIISRPANGGLNQAIKRVRFRFK